jgi:methionyl-tRNA formyltransferase
VARIAVAATAPFGADVLARLATRHDVSSLLTRPDARAGRGRRLAASPAKEVAERLGIPVLQPERPQAGLDLGAPTVVVCAYGLLVPEELLAERSWLNVLRSSRAGEAQHPWSARSWPVTPRPG